MRKIVFSLSLFFTVVPCALALPTGQAPVEKSTSDAVPKAREDLFGCACPLKRKDCVPPFVQCSGYSVNEVVGCTKQTVGVAGEDDNLGSTRQVTRCKPKLGVLEYVCSSRVPAEGEKPNPNDEIRKCGEHFTRRAVGVSCRLNNQGDCEIQTETKTLKCNAVAINLIGEPGLLPSNDCACTTEAECKTKSCLGFQIKPSRKCPDFDRDNSIMPPYKTAPCEWK